MRLREDTSARPRGAPSLLIAVTVALGCLAAADAHAGDGRELAGLLPQDAEIKMLLDCEAIYTAPLFGRVMDHIEASSSYERFADELAEWGFRPRGDVATIALAMPRLDRESAEFVIVALGTVERADVERQMRARQRLRRESDALGDYFVDSTSDVHYGFGSETTLIAGSPALFSGARARMAEGTDATDESFARPGTFWIAVTPSAESRRAHVSLEAVDTLFISLVIDESPSLHVSITVDDDHDPDEATQQLRHVLETVATTPELDAFGLADVLESAAVSVDGRRIALEASIDASEWAHFSDTLVELIAEEVR